MWVKVAEAYLESDETDAADNFCNKAREKRRESQSGRTRIVAFLLHDAPQ